MAQEIKYTSDGRKVVVIGTLNSQEKIVQEIYIIDGSEIPSGEHFTVKSLHDAPAISWKEENLKKIDQNYDLLYKELQNKTESLRKYYNEKINELSSRIQYIGKVLQKASPDSFDMIVNFITGKFEWIVYDDYGDVQILPVSEFKQMDNRELKLISIFGRDDGTLSYAINNYSDGSGSKKHFYPFVKYEDALAKLKELLLKKNICGVVIKTAKKYNIELPADKVKEYHEKEIARLEKNIEGYLNEVEKWKLTLGILKNESQTDLS